MRFVDEVKIEVSGGKGGDGAIHFRKEKYVPRGGPDGGNGGSGGAIVFRTNTSINSLIELSFKPKLGAGDGKSGGGSNSIGGSGKDFTIGLPIGTQVFFEDKLIADLERDGCVWVAARGGSGGRGNSCFVSATNQAPAYAERGAQPESWNFRLELKSVADVGLVGFPNAGKSTLVSTLSAAKPKIADYPFTTLVPSLGVVRLSSDANFVMADIPGLISGAAEGRGLGIKFLKHIERCRSLLILVDPTGKINPEGTLTPCTELTAEILLENAAAQYQKLIAELEAFDSKLTQYKMLVAISKCELWSDISGELAEELKENCNITSNCISISSSSNINLKELANMAYEQIQRES